MKLKITLFLFATTLYFGQIFAQNCTTDYEEVNGIAIIEAESKIAGSWSLRNLPGASGGQALYYAGSNQFNNPGTSAITYTLRVNNPGLYRVQLRSQIGVISTGPEPATSEHNDTWLRINGAEFFGQNGNSIVWPRGSGRTPIVAGSSGDGWLKAYTNQLGWTWNTFTNDGPGHSIFVRFTSAGTYNVQISGRSRDHIVDRIVLYQQALFSTSQATDLSRAETACGAAAPPPPPPANVDPTVSITSPNNGQSFDEGSNITVNLNSNDSDGNIVSHEIFINNASVDSDGANYTPHVITNAEPGTYNIRAVVTDDDGATASSSVSITVNEDVPPPPPPPANVAPTVSITSPTNGQSFDEGSNITVNLNSNDSDGSLVSHEIFINNTSVDSDGANYTPHVITNAEPGTYNIRAVVTDDDGATASSSVSITVNEDVPPPPPPPANINPTLNITYPTEGLVFDEGSDFTVNLNSRDSDGTVVSHEVAINGNVVSSQGSDYTPHLVVDPQAGNLVITVTVTDNNGGTASSSVNVIINSVAPPAMNVAPTVSITSPQNGQSFEEGSNITVNLSASDSDGSIQSHEVFINGSSVDLDDGTYTPHIIANARPGVYNIRAVVIDNDGAEGASSNVSITVNEDVPPPPPPGNDNNAPIITITYPFDGLVFDEGSNFTVNLNSSDSDGSVVQHEVFINGSLVSTQGADYTPFLVVDPAAGDYTIMVTVTDNDGDSTSSSVDVIVVEDEDTPPPADNVVPTFDFTTLTDGQEVAAGSVVTIGVSASDSDGSVVEHQIFVNNILVDTDPANFTPYSIVNIANGSYEIRVTVTDNEGATFTDSITITASTSSSTDDEITLYLVDAITNSRVTPILDGGSLNASQTIDSNIEAVTPEGTESVRFELSGSSNRIHIENYLPYALFRDIEGDYFRTSLSNGVYILTVKAYSDNSGSGDLIAEETFRFTVSGSTTGKVAVAFPNPVKQDGKVSIRLPEGIQGNFDFMVTNSLGAIVDKGIFSAQENERNVDLQLSAVARHTDGVYFFTIISPEFTQSIPIIRK